MTFAPPRWLVVVGFWIPFAFTTYAAFAPQGVPLPFQVSDIILHASAFTYLTAALWLAHCVGARGWTPALWMMAYGVAIEAIQSFEPTRSAEIKDLVVDAIGIGFGVLLYRFVVAKLVVVGRVQSDERISQRGAS
jgi:VanZ family protein